MQNVGSRPRRRILDSALLLAALTLFGCSLLVLFPAPTGWLWIVAIVVGEWGHYAALASLIVGAISFSRGGRLAMISTAFAAAGAVLCLMPLTRAALIAKELPARCGSAFGEAAERATRAKPFSIVEAFAGVRIPAVQVTEHVYAKSGSKELKLKLYELTRRASAQPLIVIIHGGSWNGGNKNQLPKINRYLASRGYVVAAIDYRHAPKWPFPAACDDVFRAVDYLKAQAGQFGIDPARIVLLGRSAGGQIALSAAYANREPAIRGVVAFYAPTDLALGYEKPSAPGVMDSRKVLRDYLGGTPAEKPDMYAAASPVNFVTTATPPTLLVHGALDPIVWRMHSELLAARLAFLQRPHLYLALPWATHGCDANLSGPAGQLSLYAVERFLASVVAAPES